MSGKFTVLLHFDCAKSMKNVYSADFYQGWLIEIIQVEEGFQSVCYSPCWEKFSSLLICNSDLEAISVARKHINQYGACYSLAVVLRELYETEQLSFEEWRSLQQSLQQSLAKTIIPS
jgi:hypothetical protein